VATCCDTFELSYFVDSTLVGVAICDRSNDAVSAVYCCYDPDFSELSIGTYSILKQLQLCAEWELSHLYLGLYISGCESMEYKARFLPHERLIEGQWLRFERG
jgi:arginine-tRNA-protein transferase